MEMVILGNTGLRVCSLFLDLRVERDRAENISHLTLFVIAATDTRIPKALALNTIITIEQDVHLRRLDRPMRVPTNTMTDIHLTVIERLPTAAPDRVRHTAQIFGRVLADATSALRDTP